MSVRQTPLVRCAALEAEIGGEVYLKLECLQRTGSFKLRGATCAVAALGPQQRQAGVVTASAGNHGAGLALAARAAGVSVVVFVPERTPQNKLERMRTLGADVRVQGEHYDASEAIARQSANSTGATFVSAYDDENIMLGNGGHLGAEIHRQCPNLAQVIVPVGGGGLIAGMAAELAPLGIAVQGAQPSNNCAMYESIQAGRALCTYEGKHTVAEGCEGAVCERTFGVVRDHALSVGTVSERSIVDAVAFLYRACGVVAETSAGVPVAALREQVLKPSELGATVLVISGGNIDQQALDSILAES